MKLDLHMHPLCHEYYGDLNRCHKTKELSRSDKERIETIVDWSLHRKLDVISITDHDMVLPSLYAIEYAKKQNMPIKVLPGIEMELYHNGEIVHLCAWGIREQPRYYHATPIEELARQIRDLGGIVIMNHPQYSEAAFQDCYKHLDGYELYNRDERFEGGQEFLKKVGHGMLGYRNSDYHFDPRYSLPPADPKYFPKYINDWDDDFGREWLKRFE